MALILDGNGLIQGLSAGGLPNGSIDADSLASTLDLSSKTMTFGNVTASGITFPASISASGNPNTLDDYEEGIFTPTLTYSTPGTVSVTYAGSGRQGVYRKIGTLVYVWIFIELTAFTKGTASGELRITGLPFSNPAVNDQILIWSAYNTPLPTSAGQFPLAVITEAASYVTLQYQSNNNNTNPPWPDPDSNSQYKINGVYYVA